MTKVENTKTLRQLGAIANRLGIQDWTRMDKGQRQSAIETAKAAQ